MVNGAVILDTEVKTSALDTFPPNNLDKKIIEIPDDTEVDMIKPRYISGEKKSRSKKIINGPPKCINAKTGIILCGFFMSVTISAIFRSNVPKNVRAISNGCRKGVINVPNVGMKKPIKRPVKTTTDKFILNFLRKDD